MDHPDTAGIEASARRMPRGSSSGDDDAHLALLRDCDDRTVVLVRTILYDRLHCHSLVVFGEGPDFPLDIIHSDIHQIGTSMPIGAEGLAEDLAAAGGGRRAVIGRRSATRRRHRRCHRR